MRVDSLQATPKDQSLLADLTEVIHRMVELQGNITMSQDRLANTDSVLSAALAQPHNQRQGSSVRQEADMAQEAKDLRQPISTIIARHQD